jgi:hypothetical protein
MSATTGPTLDHSEPRGTYVTTLEVAGTPPITYNAEGNNRASYRAWVTALDRGASMAAARARSTNPSGSLCGASSGCTRRGTRVGPR